MTATEKRLKLNWFERFTIDKLCLEYKYDERLTTNENAKREIIYSTNTIFDIPLIGIGTYSLWKKGLFR